PSQQITNVLILRITRFVPKLHISHYLFCSIGVIISIVLSLFIELRMKRFNLLSEKRVNNRHRFGKRRQYTSEEKNGGTLMEETISLKEIFEVIKKRWLLIVGLIVGAALLAAIISYFVLTPTYQSSSQFIVNQEQKDPDAQYNEIQTNLELIHTYNDIIKSPAILEEVVDTMDLPYGVNSLSEKIEVTNEESSQVVTLTVTDPDPEQATLIANATVKIFQKEIPDIMNVDNVSILSEAETGAAPQPVAPKPLLNIAIAIVLGGMVGVGIAFLLEYLDNTIRSDEDIEKQLGLPILGVISHMEDDDFPPQKMTINQKKSTKGGITRAQKQSISNK